MNFCPKNAKHFGLQELTEEAKRDWCERIASEAKCFGCERYKSKKAKPKQTPGSGQGRLF